MKTRAAVGRRAIKREFNSTVIEAMREAKARAAAAVGLRSWQARNAVQRGIRRYRDERLEAHCRHERSDKVPARD